MKDFPFYLYSSLLALEHLNGRVGIDRIRRDGDATPVRTEELASLGGIDSDSLGFGVRRFFGQFSMIWAYLHLSQGIFCCKCRNWQSYRHYWHFKERSRSGETAATALANRQLLFI